MPPALVPCLWIFGFACLACWLLSIVTREYSWVDRLWSLVPVVYVAVLAGGAGFRDARLDTMLVLVALWGTRLTFNFARKGGYAPGGEDYRWAVLRGRMTGWQFQLFNLFFITVYQNLILLLICLPALTAREHPGGFGALDVLAAVVFLGLLVGETVADEQQWRFQRWKRSQSDPRPRFAQAGLFRYSRHPNFFFEQAQWWVVYAFGAIAAGSPVQWTVLGAVLLVLLFVGSTRFTESISLSRYPEYADYQARTSAVIPWPPKPAPATGVPDR
jgi:steroid 5-alpha reductase family enzyme